MSAGISFDVRKLNVGDFAWIARKKAVLHPGRNSNYTNIYCFNKCC